MIKKITTVLLSSLLIISANKDALATQEVVTIGSRVYETKKFRFGAYVAPTIAFMKSTANKSDDGNHKLTNDGSSAGFTYGLMAEYWFSDNYAFVSGLQMNMTKGTIITDAVDVTKPNTVTHSNIHYKLNYLEIPLNLKMKTDPVENFTFFGQVGFSLGFNVGKKADYNILYTDGDGIVQPALNGENEKLIGTLGISPVQLSMNIGIGAEYPISNRLAGYFGVFFNNGFLPDATSPGKFKFNRSIPDFKDGNVRVNNFAFRFGLFF